MLELIKRFAICGSIKSDVSTDAPIKEGLTQKDVDPRRRFDILEAIGFPGSFGYVHVCRDKVTCDTYAIKIQKSNKAVKSEIEMLKLAKHPSIIRAIAFYEYKHKSYIVSEKYNGGDLFDAIVSQGGRFKNELDASILVKEILQGVRFLHRNNIAHCDLKLSNVMMTQAYHEGDELGHVKIIDFGVSQFVSDGMLHKEVGSLCFIAPEVIMGSYNERCDMWSVGVILFTILHGFNPFNPRCAPALEYRDKIAKNVLKGFTHVEKKGFGSWFPRGMGVSKEAKDLIAHLLTSDWRHRLTAAEALNHPWITRES